MEAQTKGGAVMDSLTKNETGFVRAMARELLVNGRCNNVYEAIQMAEDLISETTHTHEEKQNDLDNSKFKR
jgi:hypothetical protein